MVSLSITISFLSMDTTSPVSSSTKSSTHDFKTLAARLLPTTLLSPLLVTLNSSARLKISKISLPGLTRAWQILLKGIEEIRAAPNPDEAGSMILIRLAYSCNLPDPASLVKKIQASLEENKTTFNDSLEEKDDCKKNTSEIINDLQEINSIDNKTTLTEVNTFEDLVEIFKIKGELLLHAQLLSCVHLFSFEKGKL